MSEPSLVYILTEREWKRYRKGETREVHPVGWRVGTSAPAPWLKLGDGFVAVDSSVFANFWDTYSLLRVVTSFLLKTVHSLLGAAEHHQLHIFRGAHL